MDDGQRGLDNNGSTCQGVEDESNGTAVGKSLNSPNLKIDFPSSCGQRHRILSIRTVPVAIDTRYYQAATSTLILKVWNDYDFPRDCPQAMLWSPCILGNCASVEVRLQDMSFLPCFVRIISRFRIPDFLKTCMTFRHLLARSAQTRSVEVCRVTEYVGSCGVRIACPSGRANLCAHDTRTRKDVVT
ncbi:hypothetical protein BJ912DRAFT_1085630 [Pholiota molesta]|nr:hypothetical protein BJ912DRAFT_1085630 [Pholiota molesta]